MLAAGVSQSRVARRFGVTQSTISRLRTRYQTTGSTRDRPRRGQPRVTTAAQDRRIRLQHLRDRFRPCTQTARETPGRHRPRISRRTVSRRLSERGIRAHRAYVGVELDHRRRTNRLRWANQHSNRRLPNRYWQRVIFSDESRFQLNRSDGRQRVYRRRGERYARPCIAHNDRFGRCSVMVWGAIGYGWRSELVFVDGTLNAQRYRDLVLQPHVLPFFQDHSCRTTPDRMWPTCVNSFWLTTTSR